MALEQMHILYAAKVPVQRRRKNDDRNMRAPATKQSSDLGAELAGSKVIVENGNVDSIKVLRSLLDGRGRNALIAVLAQDRGAQMQVAGLVIKQQDAHGLDVRIGHPVNNARYAIWRLNHGLPPYDASLCAFSHHLGGYFSFNFISRNSSGSRLKSATDRSH